jgi:pimeloyl-ACP methyl ester carboxylesterase
VRCWAFIGLSVALLTLAVGPGPAGVTAAQASEVRLVALLLRGWNSTSTDETFPRIAPALERVGTAPEVNPAVRVEYYSYRYPEPNYARCDTNQPITASAAVLQQQLQDLAGRYPSARFLLVGHSLGGVIAARWAAAEGTPDLLARTAAIVTFDSPLQGMGEIPPEIRDVVLGWLRAQLCYDPRVLEELDVTRPDSPLAALRQVPEKLAAHGGRLYTAASRDDLALAWQAAVLPGAEARVFTPGICPDWAALTATVPALTAEVRTTDWARARAQLMALPPSSQQSFLQRFAACIQTSHRNVLRDPQAVDWLVEIAQNALAASGPMPPPTARPG